MKLEVRLSWPPKELSPNSRTYWRRKAEVAKKYRTDACWLTRALAKCNVMPFVEADKLLVSMTFFPPSNRKRDLDNLIASMKSGLDGVADGLMVNDSKFNLSAELCEQCGPAAVLVTVDTLNGGMNGSRR